MTRVLPFALSMVLTGAACAGLQNPAGDVSHPDVEPFLGVYVGSFDSAQSEDPADDLNYNPCEPAADERCLTHHAPLADILLELHRQPGGEVLLTFFRSRDDRDAGRELDLLGRGCDTRLGSLESVDLVGREKARASTAAEGSAYVLASFPLHAANRLCLGKLRPTSRHHLRLELHPATATGAARVRVVIDKNVRDTNYLYVVEDGVRRRVRIDLDNQLEDDDGERYRVCIEDDLGEYGRCVLTDREFRSFALPVPVPGGVAVSYTWWQELRPRLRRTQGLYVVERYVGRFEHAEIGHTDS
jgi:hypothetical protein